jgi:membrane-associated progesterone receptor component
MILRSLLLFICTIPARSFVVLPTVTGRTSQCTTRRSIQKTNVLTLNLVAEVGAVVLCTGAAVFWISGSEERANKSKYAEWDEINQAREEERRRLAHVEPRALDGSEPWTEAELAPFDGKQDIDGPILIGCNGKVYNVWKGRHFYGPGAEYQIFAGRDATRLLAKFRTEEEDAESLAKPLTIAERATLEGYVWTFKDKYQLVGTLEGFDPKDTAMW